MASTKKPFALRINTELLQELEKWAEDEFRSVNGQIEYLLSQAIHARKKGKKSTMNKSDQQNPSSHG